MQIAKLSSHAWVHRAAGLLLGSVAVLGATSQAQTSAPPAASAAVAAAPPYPVKPVRVVVAFTAGGTTDVLARSVSQQLTDKFRQPFIIDNKPGAGGNLGTELVVRAPPDGYTLIANTVGPSTVNPTLYPNMPFNPLTDLIPIVQVAEVPNVLVLHPSIPAKTLAEFVAYAKANPGKLNYASTGVGTSSHLSGFVLAKRAGFEATHVPYKGARRCATCCPAGCSSCSRRFRR